MMTADDLLAGRVLAFNRAEALHDELTTAIDNLHTSRTNHLTDWDENLAQTIALLLKSARAQWIGSPGALMGEEYNARRTAVVNRARAIERRATAAAEAAAHLAELFEHARHYDTADDVELLIIGLAGRIDRLGVGWNTAPNMAAAFEDVWARISSKLISWDESENLRRYYDTQLYEYLADMPDAALAVTEWRRGHLARTVWNAGTYAYAITTARTWDETLDMWRMLDTVTGPDGTTEVPETAHLTGPEKVRLRTLIADQTADPREQHTVPRALRDEVYAFNTDRGALALRVRLAESTTDLAPIAKAILEGPDEADNVSVMRALCRKFDAVATEADTMADNALANYLYQWRESLYANACEAMKAIGAGLDEDYRYRLVYNAIADAVDTGEADRLAKLTDLVEKIAGAGAHHVLTADHIANLRVIAVPRGERIDIDGGAQ
jgi:hypothetical protein